MSNCCLPGETVRAYAMFLIALLMIVGAVLVALLADDNPTTRLGDTLRAVLSALRSLRPW